MKPISSLLTILTVALLLPACTGIKYVKTPGNYYSLTDDAVAFKIDKKSAMEKSRMKVPIKPLLEKVGEVDEIALYEYLPDYMTPVDFTIDGEKLVAELENGSTYIMAPKRTPREEYFYAVLSELRKNGAGPLIPVFGGNICNLILCTDEFIHPRDLVTKVPRLGNYLAGMEFDQFEKSAQTKITLSGMSGGV